MNRIDTSNILNTIPPVQQPFTGVSLDFIQDMIGTASVSLARTLVTNNGYSYSPTTPYILTGLTTYGTNQISDGYVLYMNEVLYCPGKSDTSGYSHLVFSFSTNNSYFDTTLNVSADPIVFSNQQSYSIHDVRYLSILNTNIGTWNTSVSNMGNGLTTFPLYPLSSNTPVYLKQTSGTRIGEITMYSGSLSNFDGYGLGSGPWNGWALCNGYNGTPNLSGKFIVGYDSSGTIDGGSYSTIGNTGGESFHKLTADESGVPAHTHPLPAYLGGGVGSSHPTAPDTGGNFTGGGNNTDSNIAQNANMAHENRPPYYTLAYVMRIN